MTGDVSGAGGVELEVTPKTQRAGLVPRKGRAARAGNQVTSLSLPEGSLQSPRLAGLDQGSVSQEPEALPKPPLVMGRGAPEWWQHTILGRRCLAEGLSELSMGGPGRWPGAQLPPCTFRDL